MDLKSVCSVDNFESADVYAAGTCNLGCEYCYISKNPGFYALDKEIQKSLVDGVLLKNLKKVFIKRDSLKGLNLWGGEPSLGFDSLSKSIIDILNEFPNLNRFMTSTNFSTKIGHLTNFLDLLDSYGRKLVFNLQISIDGPEHINDKNRGDGVTQLILSNMIKLSEYYNTHNLDNIKIDLSFKATLSIENLESLTDYGSLFNYFKFFEDMVESFERSNKNENIKIYLPIGITPVYPGQYTKMDGVKLLEFLKILNSLDQENKTHNLFPHIKEVDFFRGKMVENFNHFKKNAGVGYCEAFKNRIAVMSTDHEYIAGCHRGYADFSEDYADELEANNDLRDRNVILSNRALRKSVKENYFFGIDKESLEFLTNKMTKIYDSQKSSILNIAALIHEAAIAGQADEIYLRDKKRLMAAAFIIRCDFPCLYDNLATTGSFMLKDYSRIRLYCNGALEFILKDEDWGE